MKNKIYLLITSRGMGVRLLSSIFGKNPSPSPTGEPSSTPTPAKSPIAKARLGSISKESEAEAKPVESEELAASKRAAVPSKLGIGVGGNVLAEMKARQERRISGILKQNSEESDYSERSEKPEQPINKNNSLSPNPLGGIKLRPTPPTPEESEPPKLPEKNNVRFTRPTGPDESESDRNKLANPLAGFRLRHRGAAEETESSKMEEKSNALNQIRLRATSSVVDESPSPDPSSDAKANPLSGVRLRSTGINVTDPLKSPNNGETAASEIKNESRNSLTKLKPPPLAPKPRPWSIVGSDKKTGTWLFFHDFYLFRFLFCFVPQLCY